ncbi:MULTISPECIES: L,D-transpeptidase [unclassified Streptomyces]|uniref:L,D-transpeptidase n=1 Tax=unclassified Streptomyces TaxID=2593676 RepID=UPI00381F7752
MVFPPVALRSGQAGKATRTGWFRVERRYRDGWSTLYNSPMPFSQYFSGGRATERVFQSQAVCLPVG